MKRKFSTDSFTYSPRVVTAMSLPIFVELFLQLLVGNVDQIMLSRYSQDSVAAVGIGNQVMNVIIIVVSVTSAATTIKISRFLGEGGQEKRIAQTASLSVMISVIVSALCTFVAVGLQRPVFRLLNVPDEIKGETGTYLTIVGSFIVVQALYASFSAILRAYGYMKEIMAVSIVMNAANIFGNAILINGLLGMPRLGIAGAAISTDFSKLLGLLLICGIYRKKVAPAIAKGTGYRKGFQISIHWLRPFPGKIMKDVMWLGIPSAGESFSYSMSQIVILGFINMYGTSVINTKVYCSLFANIAYLFSMAVSQAAQVAIGYLIGSGQLKKVTKCIWDTIFLSMAVSVSVTFLLWLNSDFMFGIFTDDPIVHTLGKQILMIEIVLEIGRSFNITMARNMVSIGDILFPITICIIFAWGISVVGSYFIGVVMGAGLTGMWWTMAADELIRAAVFTVRLKSGVWLKRRNF